MQKISLLKVILSNTLQKYNNTLINVNYGYLFFTKKLLLSKKKAAKNTKL
jgi:hypothetical protein